MYGNISVVWIDLLEHNPKQKIISFSLKKVFFFKFPWFGNIFQVLRF